MCCKLCCRFPSSLPACKSPYRSTCLSIISFIHPPIQLPVYPFFCVSLNLTILQSLRFPVCQSSIWFSFILSVCLSLSVRVYLFIYLYLKANYLCHPPLPVHYHSNFRLHCFHQVTFHFMKCFFKTFMCCVHFVVKQQENPD